MKDYMIKVEVTTEMQVTDCENVEEAMNFIKNHYLDSIDENIFEVEMKEV